MRARRIITTLLCVASMGPAAAAAQASDCPGADVPASATNPQQMSDAMLCLLNEQRAAAAAPALTADPQLTQMAVTYANLLTTEHFFAHVSPEGQTLQDRLAAVGYRFDAAGENLAAAGGTSATPAQIVGAWMQSPGHRENILDPDFHQLGVGYSIGSVDSSGAEQVAYVTEFGTPLAAERSSSAPASTSSSATPPATPRHRARARARARRHARAARARHHRHHRRRVRHMGAVRAA